MIPKKKTLLTPTNQVKKQSITQKLKCQMLETFQKTKRGEILSECEYRNPSFPEKLQLLERPILLVGTMHIIDLP